MLRYVYAVVVAAGVFMSACGAGEPTPVKDGTSQDGKDMAADAGEVDQAVRSDQKGETEVVINPTDAGELDGVAPPEVDAAEVQVDLGPQCGEKPYEMGCPCNDNSECSCGFCVEGREGKVCTCDCWEDCPEGYTCQLLSGTCPDCQMICLPMWVDLCRPCSNNSDCQQAGIASNDFCVDWGAEGKFCGSACETDADCPTGFTCQTIAGIATAQCLPDGTCECSQKFIDEGALTSCYAENDEGKCNGTRTCTEEGLTPCDAPVPAAETCNGKDDDCDGSVDEEMSICSGGKVCKCKGVDCSCVCPEELEDCGSGICVDLQSTVSDCGKCSAPCSAANVETYVCQGGQCKIVKCQAGFENFNKEYADGCECVIQPEVCNGVDDDCDAAVDDGDQICPGKENCVGTCVDGVCECAAGCDYCDGMCVPWESYFDDPSNCGYCGNMCALDHTLVHSCEGGNCCPVTCEEGWKDCDVYCANGCEWEVKPEECNCVDDDCDGEADEQPLANCMPPKLCLGCACQCPTDNPNIFECDGECADISLDPKNCGWCGNKCEDLQWPSVSLYGCADKSCTIVTCQKPFFNTNEVPWDGCECEQTALTELCDMLDNNCDGQIDETPFSDCLPPKECSFGFCSCPLDKPNLQECAAGKCIDVLADAKHCGFCNNDCAGMGLANVQQYKCGDGLCGIQTCKLPFVDVNLQVFDGCECQKTAPMETCDMLDNNCDGQVDETPNNCIPPKICQFGSCVCPPDKPNLQDCGNGQCTDTLTDMNNCGFCQNKCDLPNVAFQKCEGGNCVVAACKPGFKDCNQVAFDGCEFEVKPEECNGFDDDCDGETDEGAIGIGQACKSGLPGLCENGVQICENGGLKCKPNIAPNQFQEVCDNKDNNCDGQIDENNPGGGGPCSVQGLMGECKMGVLQCTNGALTCTQTVFPQAETCDAKDNDCDGVMDGIQEDCFTMCGNGKKTCNGGVWGACSAMQPKNCKNYQTCAMEDMCVQNCPAAPAEQCNGMDDNCNNQIDDGFACTIGQQKSQSCGNCGTQYANCTGTCTWGSFGNCEGQGVCSNGSTKMEGTCGNCGQQLWSCSNCQWQMGQCQNQGICSPGASKTEGTCGKCGKYQYQCTGSCQWSQTGCVGEGVCSQGSTKTEGTCGNCGQQLWSCNASCQWQQSTCQNQGACSPGSTKTEGSCGKCGKYQYTCTASCTWQQGSCTGEGTCTPDSKQWCSGCSAKTCSASCQWGSCSTSCGYNSVDGCGCDAACSSWDDCCQGSCTACSVGCSTCEEPECGYKGGSSCWCDNACWSIGDCCKDANSTCGVTQTCGEKCGQNPGWSCGCGSCGFWPWDPPCCKDKTKWCG